MERERRVSWNVGLPGRRNRRDPRPWPQPVWLTRNDFEAEGDIDSGFSWDAHVEDRGTLFPYSLEDEQPFNSEVSERDTVKRISAEHWDLARRARRRPIRLRDPHDSTSFLLNSLEDYQSPEGLFRLPGSLSRSDANSFKFSAVKEILKFGSGRIDDKSGESAIKERNSRVESSLSSKERDQRAMFVQEMVFSIIFKE